jgi:hypothetical protein
MTVIAYKDGVMAADTLANDGQNRARVQKLARLPDGGVAAMCGDCSAGYAALSWLASGGSQEGSEAKAALPDIDGACVLIARPEGQGRVQLYLLEGRFPAYPLLDTIAAEGCGAAAARVALGLGLSAVEAVMQVAKHDLQCGDPVQSLAVEPTHEYSGVTTYVPKEKTAPRRKARKARK